MSARFEVINTALTGLRVLQRKPLGDSRGYLERMYCHEELAALTPGRNILQINHTLTSRRGTVRGMHYQLPPHAETKFISCLRGEVFDVAVDLRHGSPTFLRWHAELLSAQNHRTLVVPEGFAHGFQTLADDCELLYLHTGAFAPDSEGALNAKDPRLGIEWPLSISCLSARDAGHPLLDDEFLGVAL
jgi:dTDP-4-dehydrorhamnose 3,5-epimerase